MTRRLRERLESLLTDPIGSCKSSRTIAFQADCHHTTVEKYRRRLIQEGKIDQNPYRLGTNGLLYPIRPNNTQATQ